MSNLKTLVITEYIDNGEYEKELRRLGWCIDCQGYGQDYGDGSPCKKCSGTGKCFYEDDVNE
jgi:DnaJ-class molecular chaperone